MSQSGIVRVRMPRGSEPAASNPISTEQIRRRVRLMVEI
jgi:hypothetical protein